MKNNKGFSLVELIVVIAIMAILAAVAVVSFSIYVDRAKDASDDDYIAKVLYSVKLFSMEHGVEVQGIVIPPVVDDKDDIKLIIGKGEDGNPIYLNPEENPSVYEIYDTVGDYTMQGNYQSDSFVQITPGDVNGTPDDDDDTPGDVGGTPHTHDWNIIDSVPATCVSKGSVTKNCDGCGETKTEEGMYFGDHGGEDTAPEKDGFKVWKCPHCKQIVIKNGSGNAVVPIN